jgi:hypothetical protein
VLPVLLALALAPASGTDETPAEPWVSWQAPAECPDAAQLEAAIARYLGSRPATLLPGTLRAEAIVRGVDGVFELGLVVETRGGTSLTTIRADACELLVRAAALKIAVAVDPLAVLDRVEAPASPPEPPQETEVAPMVEPPPPPPPPPPPRRVAGLIRLDGGMSYGDLPEFGGGVAITAGVAFERWRLEVAGALWPTRRARLDAVAGAGADLLLSTATVRGCPAPTLGKVELPLCLGIEGGAMRGAGFGLDDARVAARPWVAALFGLGLAWPFAPRWALRVEAHAAVALLRPEFVVEGAGRLHRANAVVPRILVGLELRP